MPHWDHKTKAAGDLTKHLANIHEIGVRWHHCPHCNYKVKFKGNLTGHLARIPYNGSVTPSSNGVKSTNANGNTSNDEKNALTCIGHGTFLICLKGITILTDPIFIDFVCPYHRHAAPGIPPEQLPFVSGIVISHGHWDQGGDLPVIPI